MVCGMHAGFGYLAVWDFDLTQLHQQLSLFFYPFLAYPIMASPLTSSPPPHIGLHCALPLRPLPLSVQPCPLCIPMMQPRHARPICLRPLSHQRLHLLRVGDSMLELSPTDTSVRPHCPDWQSRGTREYLRTEHRPRAYTCNMGGPRRL